MSAESIHAELGYAGVEADIKAQPGVWNSLKGLRSKAERDPKLWSSYRSLLAQIVKRIKFERNDVLTDDREMKAFIPWTEDVKRDHGIHELEQLRGSHFEPWCEKWLPGPFRAYVNALLVMDTAPTGTNLEIVRDRFRDLVKQYVSAN